MTAPGPPAKFSSTSSSFTGCATCFACPARAISRRSTPSTTAISPSLFAGRRAGPPSWRKPAARRPGDPASASSRAGPAPPMRRRECISRGRIRPRSFCSSARLRARCASARPSRSSITARCSDRSPNGRPRSTIPPVSPSSFRAPSTPRPAAGRARLSSRCRRTCWSSASPYLTRRPASRSRSGPARAT